MDTNQKHQTYDDHFKKLEEEAKKRLGIPMTSQKSQQSLTVKTENNNTANDTFYQQGPSTSHSRSPLEPDIIDLRSQLMSPEGKSTYTFRIDDDTTPVKIKDERERSSSNVPIIGANKNYDSSQNVSSGVVSTSNHNVKSPYFSETNTTKRLKIGGCRQNLKASNKLFEHETKREDESNEENDNESPEYHFDTSHFKGNQTETETETDTDEGPDEHEQVKSPSANSKISLPYPALSKDFYRRLGESLHQERNAEQSKENQTNKQTETLELNKQSSKDFEQVIYSDPDIFDTSTFNQGKTKKKAKSSIKVKKEPMPSPKKDYKKSEKNKPPLAAKGTKKPAAKRKGTSLKTKQNETISRHSKSTLENYFTKVKTSPTTTPTKPNNTLPSSFFAARKPKTPELPKLMIIESSSSSSDSDMNKTLEDNQNQPLSISESPVLFGRPPFNSTVVNKRDTSVRESHNKQCGSHFKENDNLGLSRQHRSHVAGNFCQQNKSFRTTENKRLFSPKIKSPTESSMRQVTSNFGERMRNYNDLFADTTLTRDHSRDSDNDNDFIQDSRSRTKTKEANSNKKLSRTDSSHFVTNNEQNYEGHTNQPVTVDQSLENHIDELVDGIPSEGMDSDVTLSDFNDDVTDDVTGKENDIIPPPPMDFTCAFESQSQMF
uniref:Uncharacterized protein n=1 Tax=Clytia hemisphaerica TaxID=252671 RepID=A0A7M5VB29_9CNID